MKKPWILITASLLLITLIGVWLYVFFGGDEAKQNLYNTFGLSGETLPSDIIDFFVEDTSTSTSAHVRQLTLRPVIGYVPIEASSSSARTVRFAEAGTGHIYSVQVDDGTEERLSNITIAGARTAVFSPNGAYAALYSESGTTITLITLVKGSSTTLESKDIPVTPHSLSFTKDNVLLYAVTDRNSVTGYAYDISKETTKTLFTIPFREAVIAWGDTESGPHYAYPKTAETLEGYAYEITGGVLQRLPISGFGLSLAATDTWILSSQYENNVSKNYVINKKGNSAPLPETSFIPEKCAIQEASFVCAYDEEAKSLSGWYQGEHTMKDALWYYVPEINYAFQIEHISDVAQRTLDATRLTIAAEALFFINKIDNSLWVYDRDFTTPVIDE